MPVVCKSRKSVRYLWSALIISTVVACVAIVYISHRFGKYFQSEVQSLKGISIIAEKRTEEKCIEVCDTEECILQYLLVNLDSDPKSSLGKLRTVYDSCAKQSSSDSEAVRTLSQYLSTFGIPNWPNLDLDFKFGKLRFIDILGHFLKYGEYGLIDISEKRGGYRKDRKTQVNVTISATESTYEKKDKSTREYLLRRVLQYFDFDSVSINGIWEESESIHDAIIHLKQANSSIYKEDDYPISVDCAVDRTTEWKFVCELLESFVDTADLGASVSKRFIDVNGDANYLQNIIPLLANFSDRSVANYLTLNLLFNHLNELNFYFRLAFGKDPTSFNQYQRTSLKIGNWQHCIEWLIKNMFLPLDHLYIKKGFTSLVIKETDDLIQEITRETAAAVSNQEWITEEVRKECGREIENIENELNILTSVLSNETLINQLYEEFQPTDVSFLHNVFEHGRFVKAEEMRRVHMLTGLLSYGSSLNVGASGGEGTMDIKFGILLPPLYRSGLQRLSNLVSLSAIVAHEIGHSFFDFTGRFKEVDQGAKKYMDERIVCLKNQYSQFRFKFTEKNVNGSRYLRENIADTVAISIIDRFIERYASEDNTFSLPGFSYSLKQMMYIYSMQVWCEAETAKEEEYNYNHAVHSLGKFRLLGMMQNSKGFAKAFNCPESSYMNIANKCTILE